MLVKVCDDLNENDMTGRRLATHQNSMVTAQ